MTFLFFQSFQHFWNVFATPTKTNTTERGWGCATQGGGRTRGQAQPDTPHTHPPQRKDHLNKKKKKKSACFIYIPRKLMLEKKKSIRKTFLRQQHQHQQQQQQQQLIINELIFSSRPLSP